MTILYFFKSRVPIYGGGYGQIFHSSLGSVKKKKRKKKLDKQLEAMFGDDRPGFLQLMDDDYNTSLKKILLVMLMEDDD